MTISPTTLTIAWDDVPFIGNGFTAYTPSRNVVMTGVVASIQYSGETVTIWLESGENACFACVETA